MADEFDLYATYHLDLIHPKGNLSKTEILTRIRNIIKKDVSNTFDLTLNATTITPQITKIKQDLSELVKYILREINALIIGLKVEKLITNDDIQNTLFEILQNVMPLTPQETDAIKLCFNLIVNNKLIKKVAVHKIIKKNVKSLLKKYF
jgi:hypothetical protein